MGESENSNTRLFIQLATFIITIVTLIIGFSVKAARIESRVDAAERYVSRVNEEGCKPSFSVRSNMAAMQNQNINNDKTLARIENELKEIKAFLMNPVR